MESPTSSRIPINIDAERSVLGCMLIDARTAESACEKLEAYDFSVPAHQDIFAAMMELYTHGSGIDGVTLMNALTHMGTLASVGGMQYITELSLSMPTTANARHYIDIVEECSVRRRLMRAGGEIASDAASGDAELDGLLDSAELKIFNISMKKSQESTVLIRDKALETYMGIGERIKMRGKLSGVTTGLIDLDKLTSGLQNSDLIIVAARPSMGKTAFALNIAQAAALKGGKTVCIFSLEMSTDQLITRLLCSEAGVDMQKVRTGYTDDNELALIATALDRVGNSNIYIDDTAGLSVPDIRSKCRRLKSRAGLDLVVIDYLQLMKTSGKSDNRVNEISEVTRALKILARELNIPIILLSQLSRGPESASRKDHIPMVSDLRESGAIEQDADVIMLLYRRAYYRDLTPIEGEPENAAECIVAKHRNGPTDTIKLLWIDKLGRFVDRSDREEPH